jgi:hypothetical protein
MTIGIIQSVKHGLISYDIKLVPGSSMSFSQLKHLLMSSMCGFPAPGSWQVLPPLILGCYPLLFSNKYLCVRQKPPYSLLIRRGNWYRFIVEALSSGSLLSSKMALATFRAHQFATACYMKTALGPFMGFKFWHLLLSP